MSALTTCWPDEGETLALPLLRSAMRDPANAGKPGDALVPSVPTADQAAASTLRLNHTRPLIVHVLQAGN